MFINFRNRNCQIRTELLLIVCYLLHYNLDVGIGVSGNYTYSLVGNMVSIDYMLKSRVGIYTLHNGFYQIFTPSTFIAFTYSATEIISLS